MLVSQFTNSEKNMFLLHAYMRCFEYTRLPIPDPRLTPDLPHPHAPWRREIGKKIMNNT